jgi:hypothetical protein
MENNKAQHIAEEMSNFVNSFSSDHQAFITEMGKDHRTLQQSFTKLCLKWIEFVGSEDYRHDLRNLDSHETCKKMVQAFQKENGHWKPSDFLRMI